MSAVAAFLERKKTLRLCCVELGWAVTIIFAILNVNCLMKFKIIFSTASINIVGHPQLLLAQPSQAKAMFGFAVSIEHFIFATL